MFTGIIESKGIISSLETRSGDVRLTIDTQSLPMDDVKLGDSIAVSGICLTVVDLGKQSFSADVSRETLETTRLSKLKVGDAVNLEKALQLQDRLGGHLVSGHVDGLGQLLQTQSDARSVRMRFALPKELARYVAPKGSITVDGISLTVNTVTADWFEVNIVPHTLSRTTLINLSTGDSVNLEVDVIARYLERLISGQPSSGITPDFLAEHGFS